MKINKLAAFLGILISSLPFVAKAEGASCEVKAIVVTPSELSKLKALNQPVELNFDLMNQLKKQGRVITIDSTQSYNCGTASCDIIRN